MLSICYKRQSEGYLLTIQGIRGRGVVSFKVDRLPEEYQQLTAPIIPVIKSPIFVDDTVFDKIGVELFKLGLNNVEVEELCRKIKKEGGDKVEERRV